MQVVSLPRELSCSAVFFQRTHLPIRSFICVDVSGGVVHRWAPVNAQVNPHRLLIEVLGEGKGKIVPVHAMEGI